MAEVIRVTGLRELQKSLKAAEAGTPTHLRVALNQAAQVVVDHAKPRIPVRSGAAVRSVRVQSTQRAARIAVGGKKAPYFPWLDFGGKGKNPGRPAKRPFIREGRYIYPSLAAKRQEVIEVMSQAIGDVIESAGLRGGD